MTRPSATPDRPRLAPDTLPALDPAVARPDYDRGRVAPGVVHLGVGGFHRAHQAMYLDALIAAGGADEWGVCGVGVLPSDERMRDALQPQDGLYTLVVKHPDGTRERRVIGSMVEYLFAPDDPGAVVERMADPAVRIVSLTVTEGGYALDSAAVLADLAAGPDDQPRSHFGLVVAALAARRASGIPPFTVLTCDNIPHNGVVARTAFVGFAQARDPELAAWMGTEVPFPNSMVDRITPVTAEGDRTENDDALGVVDAWPVVCEPFTQWVVEDAFPGGRPALEAVGVQYVPDVDPYEKMKLRLLNSSHQAMCYFGYLAGHRYAHEASTDPAIATLLRRYMAEEGAPTLPPVPGVDVAAYQETLMERFANPQVRDTLARLCAESSDRIPTWLVPVVVDQLARGGPVTMAAAVIASWARYAEGVDEQGEPITVVDQIADRVTAAAARQGEDPLAFLRDRDLFGDLVDDPRFTGPYLDALDGLHRDGAAATVARIAGTG